MSQGQENPESFATAVCCIDGRIQAAVTEFARERFDAKWVDMVTKPGVVASADESVHSAVAISVRAHASRGIVVSAHAECAANGIADEEQKKQCRALARDLAERWSDADVVPVWAPIGGKVEVL